MPHASSIQINNFQNLDVFRGIAAIAVVFFHIGSLSGVKSLAPYGYIAVDLLFIMSGFVIGNAYEEKLKNGLGWASFMKIRVARLYPSLFLGCVLGLVATPEASSFSRIAQFALIPDLNSWSLFPLNAVFWSLFFEIFINAVHAAVAPQLRTSYLAIFVAVMMIAFLGISWRLRGPGFGWGAVTFFAGFVRVGFGYATGLLLYRLWRRKWIFKLKIQPILLATILVFLLFSPNLSLTALQIPLTIFFAFPLIVSLGLASSIGETRISKWLGGISYPLYATHLPILHIADSVLNFRSHFEYALVVGFGAIFSAALIEYYYEIPLRIFMRSFLCRTNLSVNQND